MNITPLTIGQSGPGVDPKNGRWKTGTTVTLCPRSGYPKKQAYPRGKRGHGRLAREHLGETPMPASLRERQCRSRLEQARCTNHRSRDLREGHRNLS